MRGVYTSTAKIAALAAAKTIWYITPPAVAAPRIVEIIAVTVTNESNTTNQQNEVAIAKVTTAGAPAGTSNTPRPNEQNDQAAASTVLVNLTVEPTTYAANNLQEGFASLVGFRWEPQEIERIYCGGGTADLALGVRMITSPTAMDTDVRVSFREIG